MILLNFRLDTAAGLLGRADVCSSDLRKIEQDCCEAESRIAIMTSRTVASVAKRDIDFAELSIATVGGLALALIAMFLCVVPLAGNITSGRDFVVFWATGQQLIHHANPYDAAAIGQIERAAGLNPGYGILFMRNPPWALPLVLPLGLVGLRVGALLWSLVLLAC